MRGWSPLKTYILICEGFVQSGMALSRLFLKTKGDAIALASKAGMSPATKDSFIDCICC
jgi:hypothetical protein